LKKKKHNTQVDSPMKFLVFGAGAIGTYTGGSLILAGHKAVFLEQPTAVEALREQGLHLVINREDHHVPNPLAAGQVETALALGPYDAALFAVKSYDTAPILRTLSPFASQLPPFICLQNGVDNEQYLAEVLGYDKVIPATVTSAIGRRGLANVVLEKRRGVGLWSGHPLSREIGLAFEQAGLNPFLYPDPLSMKWSKLMVNLLANATSAILDMTPAEIYAHRELVRLEARQVREALTVMRAQKLKPVNLPRTPVRLLAFAFQLPLSISRPLLYRSVGRGRGAKMPSFHIDLHGGRRPSEVEYLNGAVARHAERLGLEAPVNHTLARLLTALTKGDLPFDGYTKKPEKLLAEIPLSIPRRQ
jgi:2-dehydropantoate 2-reductase